MADNFLGTEAPERGLRDAVHVAVASVEADTELKPGQPVHIRGGLALAEKPYHGVVDPFLKSDVEEGDTIWVLLYPNTVKNLRHEWEHEAFPTPVERDEWDDGCRNC